jgi:hypothetical protein
VIQSEQVDCDDHITAVDGCESGNTVIRPFKDKQINNNLKSKAKPSQNHIKTSIETSSSKNKNKPIASALEMTRIEEETEHHDEDQSVYQLPPLIHSSKAPSYQDEAVTSKPSVPDSQEETSEVASEQEEHKSSSNSTTTDEGAVEITPVTSSPWQRNKKRISKSLDIKAEQMSKALSTFKRSSSRGEVLIQNPESKGKDLIYIKESTKELKPKKETTTERFQPVENRAAAKPLTRSQNRAMEAQNKDRHLNIQETNREIYTQCPSGSKISIKKIKN